MTDVDNAAKLLADLVRPTLIDMSSIEREKEDAQRRGQDADWPWSGFILSFSTLGGSENWELRVKPRARDFSWSSVASLSDAERKKLFCTLPNPRFRKRCVLFLEGCFHKFKQAGGPGAIRHEYESIQTAKGRIRYLKTFPGIGDKYARNIPMDAYDQLVSEHFALDHRLKSIIKRVLKRTTSYNEGEEFLREVATQLGVNAWTLDRILYGNYSTLIERLDSLSNSNPAPCTQRSVHS